MKIPHLFVLCLALVLQSCYKNENITTNLAPSDFTVRATNSPNSVELKWSAAIDPEETEVTYDVKIDGTLVADGIDALSFSFENLTPDTTYLFNVIAKDSLGTPNQVSLEVRTNAALAPSAFEIEQSGRSVDNISISWNTSTAVDGSLIVYDVFWNNIRVENDFTENKYTFTDLKALSNHTVKVVAKSRYGTSFASTLEVQTDGNHVTFGEANHPTGQAMQESDYGTIELPVLVRDDKDENTSTAIEDIQFGFSIKGNVNEQDYELLTPSPLIIAKGSTMGTIKIRIIADDFQEFPFEYLIIEPNDVKNGIYSGKQNAGNANVFPQFAIEGLDYGWLEESKDAYSVAISWSNSDANVSAAIYHETSAGDFSQVRTFDEGEQPKRFELTTDINDGNYYLEIVRDDNLSTTVEVSVYITAPIDENRTDPNPILLKAKNLMLENGVKTTIFDVKVEKGLYSFKAKD